MNVQQYRTKYIFMFFMKSNKYKLCVATAIAYLQQQNIWPLLSFK